MLFCLVLVCPWCLLIKHVGAVPQVYADNLKFTSRGRAVPVLDAAAATHEYVVDIGQSLAPAKSAFLSTSPVARRAMRRVWLVAGARWVVALDLRDLGGHLDSSLHRWAGTLASRVQGVISALPKLSSLPLSFDSKVQIAAAKFRPKALYGSAASPLSKARLSALRRAFVEAVYPRHQTMCPHGSNISTFKYISF